MSSRNLYITGLTKVSFFDLCNKMQIIPIKKFNIQTCFFQFLWFFRLKCWFQGQLIPRIHLILPNAYTQMYFDRNINGTFWLGLLGAALMKETYFSLAFTPKEGPVRCGKVCNKSWVILTFGYGIQKELWSLFSSVQCLKFHFIFNAQLEIQFLNRFYIVFVFMVNTFGYLCSTIYVCTT